MRSEINFIVILTICMSSVRCSMINEHVKHAKKWQAQKYSVDDLLTMKFSYSDPRENNQYDMDPCKSGEAANINFG
jgi:hypothetical protein